MGEFKVFKSLIGMKFGLLTVEYRLPNMSNSVMYLCACDCGNETKVAGTNLSRGATTSCGCSLRAARVAEFSPEVCALGDDDFKSLYMTYYGMMERCFNPKHQAYSHYAGRGITVCQEWVTTRSTFFSWALANGWEKGLVMDRVDTYGNYEPSNIRFTTHKVNGRNKINNRLVEIIPGELLPVSEAVERYSVVSEESVRNRMLKLGWCDVAAVLMPQFKSHKIKNREEVLVSHRSVL